MLKLKEKLEPTVANMLYVAYRINKDPENRRILRTLYKQELLRNMEQYYRKCEILKFFESDDIELLRETWDKYGNTHMAQMFNTTCQTWYRRIGDVDIWSDYSREYLAEKDKHLYGTIYKPRVVLKKPYCRHLNVLPYPILKKYIKTLAVCCYSGETIGIKNPTGPESFKGTYARGVTLGVLLTDPQEAKICSLSTLIPVGSPVVNISFY